MTKTAGETGLAQIIILILGLVVLAVAAFLVLSLPQTAPVITNPDKKYQDLTNSLLKITHDQSPLVALDTLSKDMDKDPKLANVCHGITHLIGQAAYQKYGSFDEALKYKDELCGSGYIHGVIEEKLSTSTDIIGELKTLCKPQNDGNCYHGVGHGAMYFTGNNLPKSLTICDSFPTDTSRGTCYEGVFMENFNTDLNAHPNKYLKNEDTFYPCTDVAAIYKGACYFYAPRYFLQRHIRTYQSLLNFCNQAEDNYKLTCLNGAGSAVMKENIDNPSLVLGVCRSSINENYCIDGMVSYYMVHYYSVQKGSDLCQTMSGSEKDVCLQSVQKRISFFPV